MYRYFINETNSMAANVMSISESVRPIKTYSYRVAQRMHKKQWLSGKHKEWGDEDEYFFPFEKYKNIAEGFVLVKIPINDLETSEGSNDRVKKYASIIKSGVDMGPAWGVYGRFRRDGSFVEPHNKGKISILDGNHRTAAARKSGKKSMRVIMPDISFRKYSE